MSTHNLIGAWRRGRPGAGLAAGIPASVPGFPAPVPAFPATVGKRTPETAPGAWNPPPVPAECQAPVSRYHGREFRYSGRKFWYGSGDSGTSYSGTEAGDTGTDGRLSRPRRPNRLAQLPRAMRPAGPCFFRCLTFPAAPVLAFAFRVSKSPGAALYRSPALAGVWGASAIETRLGRNGEFPPKAKSRNRLPGLEASRAVGRSGIGGTSGLTDELPDAMRAVPARNQTNARGDCVAHGGDVRQKRSGARQSGTPGDICRR